jgi:hypothetical protein
MEFRRGHQSLVHHSVAEWELLPFNFTPLMDQLRWFSGWIHNDPAYAGPYIPLERMTCGSLSGISADRHLGKPHQLTRR